MNIFYLLKKKFAFNQTNRDSWIKSQSKQIGKGLNVIDIGAGSAPYRNLFQHCEYKTQDLAKLKDDQLRGYKGYTQIDIVSDITNIPVGDESFDVILCTEVLEHVPHPVLAIKEFSRILKKGGILLLTAPLGSGLHQEPYHFYGGFTPYWYEKFLTENGFQISNIESNMKFYSFFSQEYIRFIRRSAPWKSALNLCIAPFWILLFPFAVILPILAPLLDNTNKQNDFTIGYHVKAIKL